MNIRKYFWGLNEKALKEVQKIIKDPKHPKFIPRIFTLLSRCDKPKELFSLISKEQFIEIWPKIQRYWKRNPQSPDFQAWWQTVYEQLLGTEKRLAGKPAKEFQNIGTTIKKMRIKMGWSQLDFARRVGMKQPDISAIEKGRKNITLETLIRLCKTLDLKNINL